VIRRLLVRRRERALHDVDTARRVRERLALLGLPTDTADAEHADACDALRRADRHLDRWTLNGRR
jgi:hypothetical protein